MDEPTGTNAISGDVVDAAYKIHTTLGPGLFESVERVAPVHKKQVLTYIRLGGFPVGLLLNFGARRIKDGITRLVNGLPD